MEDFVTWVDTSKLKRTIMQYNDEVRNIATLLFGILSDEICASWTTMTFSRAFASPLIYYALYHVP